MNPPVALISVSDKTGIIELASVLVKNYGFTIISSGGTAAALKSAQIPVTKVADYTGAPEILGGRVKTLHPRVHGGILARLDVAADLEDLKTQQIQPIALVVVNLYPFSQTISQSGVTLDEAIEQIDIGGPTMIRAAAKNHQHVTVLVDSGQYADFLSELTAQNGKTSLEFRRLMALEAFRHTQSYDLAISSYLAEKVQTAENKLETKSEDFATGIANSTSFALVGQKPQVLRYGENPHQKASWYQFANSGWSSAQQLQGKELSYNNLLDLEAARAIIAEFIDVNTERKNNEQPSEAKLASKPCAVIVKHNNPCGVAIAETLADAYQKAFDADAVSAFGGIVAFNQTVDFASAQALTATFLECLVAPSYDAAAIELLKSKPNLRVLALPNLTAGEETTVKIIAGGFLVQKSDDLPIAPETWEIVTNLKPTEPEMAEMAFAWKVARHVKSNAIVVTKNLTTIGIGAGQMNRVGAAQIAIAGALANQKIQGATLASDGFLPFDDTVKLAAAAGIKFIIQPGGSIRDQDSINAANDLGLIMVFTHTRHFWH